MEKKKINEKVRNHCPITGNYRGAANKICHLTLKQMFSSFIPIALTNKTNYDSLSIFKGTIKRKKPIVTFKVTQQTDQRFQYKAYGRMRFFKPMILKKLSLDTEVNALDPDDFFHVKKIFRGE